MTTTFYDRLEAQASLPSSLQPRFYDRFLVGVFGVFVCSYGLLYFSRRGQYQNGVDNGFDIDINDGGVWRSATNAEGLEYLLKSAASLAILMACGFIVGLFGLAWAVFVAESKVARITQPGLVNFDSVKNRVLNCFTASWVWLSLTIYFSVFLHWFVYS